MLYSMEPLTRKEEVLRLLFKLERAFVKDLIAAYPGKKKPAHSTRRLLKP